MLCHRGAQTPVRVLFFLFLALFLLLLGCPTPTGGSGDTGGTDSGGDEAPADDDTDQDADVPISVGGPVQVSDLGMVASASSYDDPNSLELEHYSVAVNGLILQADFSGSGGGVGSAGEVAAIVVDFDSSGDTTFPLAGGGEAVLAHDHFIGGGVAAYDVNSVSLSETYPGDFSKDEYENYYTYSGFGDGRTVILANVAGPADGTGDIDGELAYEYGEARSIAFAVGLPPGASVSVFPARFSTADPEGTFVALADPVEHTTPATFEATDLNVATSVQRATLLEEGASFSMGLMTTDYGHFYAGLPVNGLSATSTWMQAGSSRQEAADQVGYFGNEGSLEMAAERVDLPSNTNGGYVYVGKGDPLVSVVFELHPDPLPGLGANTEVAGSWTSSADDRLNISSSGLFALRSDAFGSGTQEYRGVLNSNLEIVSITGSIDDSLTYDAESELLFGSGSSDGIFGSYFRPPSLPATVGANSTVVDSGSSANVSLSVVGPSLGSRSLISQSAGIRFVLESLADNDVELTEIGESIEITGTSVGDTLVVTPVAEQNDALDQPLTPTVIEVTEPQLDGGAVFVTDVDYSFKTDVRYRSNPYLFDTIGTQEVQIITQNFGTEDAPPANVTISADPDVTVSPSTVTVSSIPAGGSVSNTVSVTYSGTVPEGTVHEETLVVSATDGVAGAWEDTVTLRFYPESSRRYFSINVKSPEGSSMSQPVALVDADGRVFAQSSWWDDSVPVTSVEAPYTAVPGLDRFVDRYYYDVRYTSSPESSDFFTQTDDTGRVTGEGLSDGSRETANTLTLDRPVYRGELVEGDVDVFVFGGE